MRQAIKLSSTSLVLLVAVLLHRGALADEPNQAGLVILLGDGQVETHCVSLDGEEITGADLLAHADLDAVVDPSRGMGITVCQIEDVGCAFPAEPCFCQCMGGGECTYWNYFYRDPGDTGWLYSALGAALRKVKAGSVEAWVWGDGHAAPDGDLTFDIVCSPPAVTPTAALEPPTPLPATSTAAPAKTQAPHQPTTALPSATDAPPAHQPATALPSTTDSPPTRQPATAPGSSQSLVSYWPFGLTLLGLALVGALVWFRRT
ncbi:hypothetical protein ACFLYD_00865 [Chloroflexota bacterium]